MHIRDRIVEFTRVPARELAPSPRNWRTHPDEQREALRGVLAEIGFAGAILARRRDDGRLEIIDGHLRAETTPDLAVPVLVLDVTEDEADLLLLTFDPLAALAERDAEKFSALATRADPRHPAVRKLIAAAQQLADKESPPAQHLRETLDVPETFAVLVDCENETQQQAIYQRLTSEGFECRLLML